MQATNGDFYGTAAIGGAKGEGTVFKITSAGALTTLYSFCSQPYCTDGVSPNPGLVQTTNADLYGTTNAYGAGGGGTFFKITPSGELTTIYSFCRGYPECLDAAGPSGGLVLGTDGDFYGTAGGGATRARERSSKSPRAAR